MNVTPSGRRKTTFLTAAVILTLSGVAGVFGNNSGYTDALFEPDYTILRAPPDGPLAEAGFQPGDSVISVEGIPVVELGMYSRWPRSLARAPGESLSMTVERGGERVTGEIVYREPPPSSWKMQFGALLVFLSFLWAGVWVLLTIPSAHAARLAALGLAAGLVVPTPSMGSWNGIAEHVHMAAMVLWALLLLRFFLFFPKPKRIAQGHLTTFIIYAPWVLLLGCLVTELIFHPRFYNTFGWFTGLLMLTYVVLAVAALAHSWVKTPREEARASGLGRVLAGVAVGVGGVILWAVDALVLQGFDIPGSNWAPVLFGVIPIGMALGVKKAASRKAAPSG
jgi:hypothetical protein